MKLHLLLLTPLLLAGCAAPLKELYPDSYFTQDGVYQNKPLRFSLTFRGNWVLMTDAAEMRGGSRDLARQLARQNGELLFVGATIEGTQGVRGIAVNLNATPRSYAEQIRALNKSDIAEDFGLTEMLIDGMPMVRWDYLHSGFRFVEFFFTLDTYNLRVAFWAKPALFERFEPVYLDIMSSLAFTDRY